MPATQSLVYTDVELGWFGFRFGVTNISHDTKLIQQSVYEIDFNGDARIVLAKELATEEMRRTPNCLGFDEPGRTVYVQSHH
jgi:hypothetical protein